MTTILKKLPRYLKPTPRYVDVAITKMGNFLLGGNVKHKVPTTACQDAKAPFCHLMAKLWRMGLASGLLFLLLLPVCTIASCTRTNNIKVAVKDLYYEEFYFSGRTSQIFTAELALDNQGSNEVRIDESFILDNRSVRYRGYLLYKKWTKTSCLSCKGDIIYKKIDCLEPGKQVFGYFMLYEDLPRSATGLRLVLQTAAAGLTIHIPDANLARVITIPGFRQSSK